MDYEFTQFDCLVRAVYHEARGEPVHGQQAVAKVILNRLKSPAFPNTLCAVVKQKGQFPWFESGAWTMPDKIAAEASWSVALQSFDETCDFPFLFFHRWRHKGRTRSVMPCAYGAKRIWIGNHVFY